MNDSLPFDPLRAFKALNQHDVRYVVIGGMAAAMLGSAMLTFDLDICYARDETNLRALARALAQLHARLRGAPDSIPFQLDEFTLRNGDHFTFVTDAGNLDLLGIPRGSDGYDQLIRDSSVVELDANLGVSIVSLESLIRMKEATGRPQDIAAVEVLAALRDELEELRLEAEAAREGVSKAALIRRAAAREFPPLPNEEADPWQALSGWLEGEPIDDIDAVIYGPKR